MRYLINYKIKINNVDESMKKACLKIMVQFCKKHKFMHHLYTKDIIINYPHHLIDFGLCLSTHSPYEQTLSSLQLSQLWRFFLLDAIENDEECKCLSFLKSDIKARIERNGYRNSKQIRKLFKAHNFISKNFEDG